jgi:hypothetical protein
MKKSSDKEAEAKAKAQRKQGRFMVAKSKAAAVRDQRKNVDKERMKNILKRYGYSGRQLGPMKLSIMDALIREIVRKPNLVD